MGVNKAVLEKIAELIDERIAERTGLTLPADIAAYSHFVHHANFNDGIILLGDVQHEFYRDLLKKSSEPMKVLERAYQDAVGNHVHEDLNGENAPGYFHPDQQDLRSPLSGVAKKQLGTYYRKFILAGLIKLPSRFSTDSYGPENYPVLTGYNYRNDPDFYERSQDGTGRKLKLNIKTN